jgi:hypothetical protein
MHGGSFLAAIVATIQTAVRFKIMHVCEGAPMANNNR